MVHFPLFSASVCLSDSHGLEAVVVHLGPMFPKEATEERERKQQGGKTPVGVQKGESGIQTFKIDLGVVEQEDFDLASVIGIDHARARVDEVLGCEPAARRDASVWELPRERGRC